MSVCTDNTGARTLSINVAPNVAGFRIGGYVVAEKWLKDRKNRKLSYDERVVFPQILIALAETAKIMDEIALADDENAM